MVQKRRRRRRLNTLLETGHRQPPITRACKAALQSLRSVISDLAEQAGLRDPDQFALSWHVLMHGAILSAEEGDLDAAKRAQTMARSLMGHYRQKPSDSPPR
jgi:hypothetical protein